MAFNFFEPRTLEGPFRILTLCTGNVCRSPYAAAMLSVQLSDLEVEVASAGTHALVGSPATPQTSTLAQRLGVDRLSLHVAKQLRMRDLETADLILALSRRHRRQAVEMLPKTSARLFTLRELARLIESVTDEGQAPMSSVDPGARMRDAVSFLAQMRGTVRPPGRPEDDDVVDPYNRPMQVYEQSASEIEPSVKAIATMLRSVSTPKEEGGKSLASRI